jgi:hypothetical protein
MPLKVLALVVAAVLVPAGALAASQNGRSMRAVLKGGSEIPKGDPDGTGTVSIRVAGSRTVCWSFALTRILKPTAAHIHRGSPGSAGPVVIPLGKTYKARGCVIASATVVRALVRHPRRFYVNVHNTRYPGGALRGQLHSTG